MSNESIHFEPDGEVAVLRIDRPPANALTLEFCEAIERNLAEVVRDDGFRALVLTGTGSCFSAGLDLKLLPKYTPSEQRRLVEALNRLFLRLYAHPLPTVIALNGHAMAGGMVLTLCCDYRIAREDETRCGLAEVRVGVPYPVGAIEVVRAELSQPMLRLMGQLGRSMPSTEARENGVLDETVAADQVMPRALAVARELGEMPRRAYQRVKQQVRDAAIATIETAIRDESDPALESWITEEAAKAAAEVLAGKRAV